MTESSGRIFGERQALHGLLKSTADVWLEASVEPIIIGWYRQPTKFPNDRPLRLFRIQYGAHSWSTGGFSFPTNKARLGLSYYERFEESAVVLRDARWDRLAASLFARSGFMGSDEEPNVEMSLVIEGRESVFAVRSKDDKEELCFLVAPDGLVPHPPDPRHWFDALPNQWIPPVCPPSYLGDKAGREGPDDMLFRVNWWYGSPLIEKDEAVEFLGKFLTAVFARLSRLGETVAIATSPNRFNDAAGDENWLAALVDGHLWENGVYFETTAETLAKAPRSLHEAVGLLQEVLASGLRQRFAKYLGNACAEPDTLVLSFDARGPLIAFSESHDDGGPVYRIDLETGLPALAGVAPRLDWRFHECQNSSAHVIIYTRIDEWISGADVDGERGRLRYVG